MKTLCFALFACVACIALCGCYATTGVMQTGKDTYSVVVDGNGAAYMAKGALMKRAYATANKFCTTQGKVMVPDYTAYTPAGLSASYELRFFAVAPDDPIANVRPDLRPVADTVIEVQGAK